MIVVNERTRLEWRDGMTAQDVLDAMGYRFSLITVTINGEFVPKDDYDEHRIPDGADVRAIHLHHGG